MSKDTDTKEPLIFTTKIKFQKSERTGSMVGFVTQRTDGVIIGVRESSHHPKKICILSPELMGYILPDTLYDVKITPMKHKKAYIVLEAVPTQFNAYIETSYVPKALYQVTVKFGNKSIDFDPHEGIKKSVYSIDSCVELISKRLDIKNVEQVCQDFMIAAKNLLNRYRNDGFVKIN